ncbi:uncharacterized protein M6B38_183710 [Iris pallida]|uniref:Uncharacterized protein n=1 Tax=Iris pallida TaxID=29817 RepID=A0AAX6EK61_IRIPA|nr:uncharacterized protein M6B38_183710 [Iris pallida]
MMLTSDDLDLNRLFEPEPAKEALRRGILQHEIIFRSQVRELHRLYWTQLNLTRDVNDSGKEVKGKLIDINESPPVDVENVAFGVTGEAKRSAVRGASNLYCYEVIDLEAPAEAERNAGADPVSSARNGSPFVPAAMHAGHCVGWRGPMAPYSRSGFCETKVDASIGLNQKEPPPASKPLLIDLNVAQDDESSHDFDNPILTFTSPSSSLSVIQQELWRDQGSSSKVTCDTLNSDAPNPALEISKGKNDEWWLHGCQSDNSKVRETIQNHEHHVNNKVQGSTSIGSAEYPGNLFVEFSRRNAEVQNSTGVTFSSTKFSKEIEENANSSSGKHPFITHSGSRRQTSIITSSNDREIKQVNNEVYEEDTVSSHTIAQDDKEDGTVAKFSTGSKCNHMTDGSCDTSSQDKSTGESSGTTQLESQVPEQINPNHEDQAAEMDSAVIGAADALVRIALDNLSSLVDKSDNTTPTMDIEDEEDWIDEPQYSSDSFASMTLNLPEVKSKCQMPTKEFESGAGAGSSGVNNLRRGRRRAVRDFQKDILPGMASLSRHEICEDMHSIGYKLKRTCEDNWFVPVRSRRSRHYSACRRH